VRLTQRRRLETRHRRIDAVYFLDSGIASVVAADVTGQGIEVGILGCEGMTGLAVLMGADRSPFDTFMQLSGAGHCITTAHLRQCMQQSESLRRALLRYGYGFVLQIGHTAVANGRHTVEERLARWLLMAHDQRGMIVILDRKGLVQRANGSYGAAEAEHRRLVSA
jgi:CRP-like cAMP-binding protein